MKRPIVALIAALLCSGAAQAEPVIFSATLTGPEEFPPNSSPATGTALVEYDLVAHTFSVDVTFAGLLAPSTVAHIHCCIAPPGVVPPATTTPTFPGFPAGVMSGTYSADFDLTSATSFNASFVTNFGGGTLAGAEAALFAGLSSGAAYFNIHTQLFPGGEIRGFFTRVPEPGSLALMGLSIAMVLVLRRRHWGI